MRHLIKQGIILYLPRYFYSGFLGPLLIVRTQNMINRLTRITVAVLAFVAVGILGVLAFEETCFPLSSHGPISLACNIAMYTPIYAAVTVGIIMAWRSSFYSVAWAILATSIGLAILFRGFFSHWYGSDIEYTIQFVVLWCLMPTTITAGAISGCNWYRRRNAF